MAWYDFLLIPLSKKAKVPEKKLTWSEELRSVLGAVEGTSVVYIQVASGNPEYVAGLVNGRLITPRTIVSMLDERSAVGRLERLADSGSRLYVGSASYPRDGETVTRLLLAAQNRFEERNYAKESCQEQPSLPCLSTVPA